jgi:hypothetical protein
MPLSPEEVWHDRFSREERAWTASMQGQPSLPVVTEDDDAEGGMLYRYCSYFRIAGHDQRLIEGLIITCEPENYKQPLQDFL